MQHHIQKKFQELGVECVVEETSLRNQSATIDVVKTKELGEHFQIRINKEMKDMLNLQVIDFNKKDRHLLLLIQEKVDDAQNGGKFHRNNKVLCGHDERQWFSANVEDDAVNIKTAMETLKPDVVQKVQKKERRKNRNKRHNKAFKRQGEWFFVPAELPEPHPYEILKNEPIQRPRGTPHIVEEVYRTGGRSVWVHPQLAPNGVGRERMERIADGNPLIRQQFRNMRSGARVFARGKIRHPDHKTIKLQGWHEVHMSTESTAAGPAVFLD